MSEQTMRAAPPVAGLLRRMGALVSDSLVVVGLFLLATVPVVPWLNAHNKKALVPSEVGWSWTLLYWGWLLSLWMAFFAYFWSRGGQTIGMRAWRIKVESEAGQLLNVPQALRRLWLSVLPWLPGLVLLALSEMTSQEGLKYLGQGLLSLGVVGWLMLYLPRRRTWHDRLSESRIILLPKL